jgi:hypothetical protein
MVSTVISGRSGSSEKTEEKKECDPIQTDGGSRRRWSRQSNTETDLTISVMRTAKNTTLERQQVDCGGVRRDGAYQDGGHEPDEGEGHLVFKQPTLEASASEAKIGVAQEQERKSSLTLAIARSK